MRVCNYCKKQIQDNEFQCPYCGTIFCEITCSKCGKTIDLRYPICKFCNTPYTLPYGNPYLQTNDKKDQPAGNSRNARIPLLKKHILSLIAFVTILFAVAIGTVIISDGNKSSDTSEVSASVSVKGNEPRLNDPIIAKANNDESKIELCETPSALESVSELSPVIDIDKSSGLVYANNEILIVTKPTTTATELYSVLTQSDILEVDDSLFDIGIVRVRFSESKTIEQLQSIITEYKATTFVEDAFLNVAVEMANDGYNPVYPNDDWYNAIWLLEAPRGQNWGMEAIDAPGAWAYYDFWNSYDVRIGLIDSIPDSNHEDLSFAERIVFRYNTKTGSYTTQKNQEISDNPDEHGTHVSGIMNAKWNNGTGVSGVMRGKGILYYCSVDGYYEDQSGIHNLYFATAHTYLLALKTLIDSNVQVINISQNTNRLLGFAASRGNQKAQNYLQTQAQIAGIGLERIIKNRTANNKRDFVICVAAGNNNAINYVYDENALYGYRELTDWEELAAGVGYRYDRGSVDARYNNFLNLIDIPLVRDRIIVVGAVGINYDRSTDDTTIYEYAYFSNIGPRVDVSGPGVDIYSCIESNRYDTLSGTSMATPHVAGVAGLLFSADPKLSGPEVKNIIVSTAVGEYNSGSSGMVNARKAVEKVLFRQEGNFLYIVDRSLDDDGTGHVVMKIYGSIIVGYVGKENNMIIPETLGGYPAKSIGENAFKGAKFSSVSFENATLDSTYIGEEAFANCDNLREIELPENLRYVHRRAFYGCDQLSSVVFKGYHIVESQVFEGCSNLKSIQWRYEIVGQNTFKDNLALETISFPDFVGVIDQKAFYNCIHLKTVNLPLTLCFIGKSAFEGCSSLDYLAIPEGIDSLPERCFAFACINKLILPRSLNSIYGDGENQANEKSCFYKATIKEAVVYRNSYAEQFCKRNSIKYSLIDDMAFQINVDMSPNEWRDRGNYSTLTVNATGGQDPYVYKASVVCLFEDEYPDFASSLSSGFFTIMDWSEQNEFDIDVSYGKMNKVFIWARDSYGTITSTIRILDFSNEPENY